MRIFFQSHMQFVFYSFFILLSFPQTTFTCFLRPENYAAYNFLFQINFRKALVTRLFCMSLMSFSIKVKFFFLSPFFFFDGVDFVLLYKIYKIFFDRLCNKIKVILFCHPFKTQSNKNFKQETIKLKSKSPQAHRH